MRIHALTVVVLAAVGIVGCGSKNYTDIADARERELVQWRDQSATKAACATAGLVGYVPVVGGFANAPCQLKHVVESATELNQAERELEEYRARKPRR